MKQVKLLKNYKNWILLKLKQALERRNKYNMTQINTQDMTQINTQDSNTIYLILDGNKTVDKASFITELDLLLRFKSRRAQEWDVLKEDLNLIAPCICSGFNKDSTDSINKIIVIWLDPLNFSKYNNADFLTAIDILKYITEQELHPLSFVLATNIINVNTDLFK